MFVVGIQSFLAFKFCHNLMIGWSNYIFNILRSRRNHIYYIKLAPQKYQWIDLIQRRVYNINLHSTCGFVANVINIHMTYLNWASGSVTAERTDRPTPSKWLLMPWCPIAARPSTSSIVILNDWSVTQWCIYYMCGIHIVLRQFKIDRGRSATHRFCCWRVCLLSQTSPWCSMIETQTHDDTSYCVIYVLHYIHEQTLLAGGWKVGNPSVSLLLAGSSFHEDNALCIRHLWLLASIVSCTVPLLGYQKILHINFKARMGWLLHLINVCRCNQLSSVSLTSMSLSRTPGPLVPAPHGLKIYCIYLITILCTLDVGWRTTWSWMTLSHLSLLPWDKKWGKFVARDIANAKSQHLRFGALQIDLVYCISKCTKALSPLPRANIRWLPGLGTCDC